MPAAAKAPLPNVGRAYLRALLPRGWDLYFTARRAGRYWGLSIVCPVDGCRARPPSEVRSGQRWRWLSSHMAIEHDIHGKGK